MGQLRGHRCGAAPGRRRRRHLPAPPRVGRDLGLVIGAPLGRGSGDVRRHNLAAVLAFVHQRGEASRAELTQATGLNRSTIGDLVGGLVAAGLVVEEPPGTATGRVGRPSLVVAPRPSSVWVLAAHVDVHDLDVAAVGLGGRVLGRRRAATAPDQSPQEAVRQLVVLAEELGGGSLAGSAGLVGIAVAVPGTVHAREGTVAAAPNKGWSGVPLASMVAQAVGDRSGASGSSRVVGGVPVRVANDADLGVLAERTRGAAVGLHDVVYLSGTYGLGGGVISGGHPVTGSRGYAGEIGHVSVDPAGRACRCGARGCWESEASAAAWAEPLGLDPDAPDIAARILERLDAGGVAARRTRDRVSRTFARGLAGVINIFDPQVVLLGAGLWQDLWPAVAGDVLPWVDRLVMPALRDTITVVPSGLGGDSTVLGAAELALADLLADPLGCAPDAVAG